MPPHCFFFPSHLLYSHSFSLSLLVVTQIRGHNAGYSPSPLRFVPCIFIAGRLQPFLPSPTRVDLVGGCYIKQPNCCHTLHNNAKSCTTGVQHDTACTAAIKHEALGGCYHQMANSYVAISGPQMSGRFSPPRRQRKRVTEASSTRPAIGENRQVCGPL